MTKILFTARAICGGHSYDILPDRKWVAPGAAAFLAPRRRWGFFWISCTQNDTGRSISRCCMVVSLCHCTRTRLTLATGTSLSVLVTPWQQQTVIHLKGQTQDAW